MADQIVITTRYPDFLQEHHDRLLNLTEAQRLIAILDSPYSEHTPVEVDDAFFGTGFEISDYPSVFDMYGKYMAGLDIETVWNRFFTDFMTAEEIENKVSEEVELLTDAYETKILSKYMLSSRDINAVQSSSFIIGKANLENKRQFDVLELMVQSFDEVIPQINQAHANFLNFQKETIKQHGLNTKLFYTAALYVNDRNYKVAAEDVLWPFTVLEYERKNLMALTGNRTKEIRETKRSRSKLSQYILVTNYTYQGMTIGGMIVPGWGHAIGAIIGQHLGIGYVLIEEGKSIPYAMFSYEQMPGYYPFAWFA